MEKEHKISLTHKMMWLVDGFNPLKNVKVSWDDSSQYMESHKIHVPNHQPDGESYMKCSAT